MAIKAGKELIVKIEKFALGGKGLSRVNGEVLFVDGGIPGATVRVKVTRKKKSYSEARILEVIEPSPDESPPFCFHASYCGGCYWQRVNYDRQLEWKERLVRETLEHLGNLDASTVRPITPSPETLYYRNKMEFAFSARRWFRPDEIAKEVELKRDCGLGLHVKGHFDRVFNVEECYLESPQAVDLLKTVREFCRGSGLPAYDINRKEGFWRFLVIREGKNTDQRLIHLITTTNDEAAGTIEALGQMLEKTGMVTTFVHSTNDSLSQVAFGESSIVLFGQGYIEERLGNFRFRISPNSFFQTNPRGAEILYGKVLECAGLTGGETVWDLYCGTGSISIFVAPHARRVVGVELVEEAVADAYVNVELNGIENCTFHAGDIKEVIRELSTDVPDVIITDPPRAGMNPKVIRGLKDVKARRLVAVSCNPATLARDLSMLADSYRLLEVYPFDMFPHTPHIECVALLERK
ncbi:23S rRNA (uracil(1939)-C(5))-methyltransferase RlmD [Thermodesulforhabdus norvegica]|uniref:23S rRNA (Uracil1939-C5)-methyltransferase n=1 Tax=Thermodesulforhabdus norvegica TaxID=39841 RepID=A0A1I4QKE9_9BACT|nr:23S rRNA (uracil(1939)-C(5))-methyltransferase RlmD [Thermodesulforhabdus norvegica]SFM40558.1 23S rRNA (uracil1939-C5)-methyltransferase [Thermodesulforhabdus norvegica]